MQQELLIALTAGFGGMLGWGLADFFAKKTIDAIGSIVSLVWAHVFGTVILILFVLYELLVPGKVLALPHDGITWGLLMFFGALQAVVYLLAYKAFEKGKLAIINPLFASYSGIAAFLSIVFLGEKIHPLLLVALLIIFSGVIFLNVDQDALKAKRLKFIGAPGLKEVVLAALLAAIWTVSWDQFVGGKDWVIYALCMYGFMTGAAFIIAKVMRVKLAVKKPGVWKFLVLIGLCEVIAYLAISYGFSLTSYTSIVAVLSGAFSLPTVILARIFLKEKTTFTQAVASILIILGVVVLFIQ